MIGRFLRTLLGCLAMLSIADAAGAQTAQRPLERVLVGNDVPSAILSSEQAATLGQLLAIEINSLPVQTTAWGSSADLVFGRLNYGTLFLERAFPIGLRRLHAFASMQGARWADLDAIDMDEGDLAHRAAAFLDRPAIESRARVTLYSQTVTLGATYGLTANFDLGAAVPIQRVCVDGSRSVRRTPGSTEQTEVTDCEAGIGDALLRAKYVFGDSARPVRWAVHAALSSPTGDRDRLTGSGSLQGTLAFVVSEDRGGWQPTASVGATVGGGGVQFETVELFGQRNFVLDSIGASPSVNVGGGLNIVSGARMTVSLEVMAKVRRNAVEFRIADPGNNANLELLPDPWQPKIHGAAAVKYRVANRWIAGIQAMNQLSRAGLRPSWVIGGHVTYGDLALSN